MTIFSETKTRNSRNSDDSISSTVTILLLTSAMMTARIFTKNYVICLRNDDLPFVQRIEFLPCNNGKVSMWSTRCNRQPKKSDTKAEMSCTNSLLPMQSFALIWGAVVVLLMIMMIRRMMSIFYFFIFFYFMFTLVIKIVGSFLRHTHLELSFLFSYRNLHCSDRIP